MIYLKENAVGIDVVINDIQKAISNAVDWTNYNAYHRIYKNEIVTGVRPEWYKDISQAKVGEYEEVYLNDNLNASSFVYVANNIDTVDLGRLFTTVVSVVFQIDLGAVTGDNDNRNDEEIHQQIILAINKSLYGQVNSLVTGIANTYTEFNVSQVQFDDMQPFHCFRVDVNVSYQYDCKDSVPIVAVGNEVLF